MKPLSFRVIISAMLACLFVFATEAQSTVLDVACDPAALVAAIETANSTAEVDTLNLAADCVYTFTSAADIDATIGDSALPRITTPIMINGSGATLRRDILAPNFRLMRVESDGALSLEHLTISGGKGSSGAGAYNFGVLTLQWVTMSGNNAHLTGADGGAIYNYANAMLVIDQSTFSENNAQDFGGAILNRGDAGPGIIRITDSTFTGNTSARGGGVSNNGGNILIVGSVLSSNTAITSGGAIADNSAGGSINIWNSTISGNVSANGGGITNSGPMTIVNSLLAGNHATQGGALNAVAGTVTITNSTISGNSADVGGGIRKLGSVSLYNNIIWGNSTQISGTGIVANNNIIEGGYTGTGNLNADPLFVSPVSHTLAPTTAGDYRVQANSPALNLGNNSPIPIDQYDLDDDADTNEPVPHDLDGNPRVVNGTVDIGAYEHQTPASVVLSKNTISLSEGGATDTYTVGLASKPTANVTVTPTGDSQCTVSAPLIFTTSNWNTAQSVTVTAVDDATAEGEHTCAITHAAVSSDTSYSGISVADVTGNISDDDPFPADLLFNGGFEANDDGNAIPDGWTITKKTSDKLVCSVSKAHSGNCTFRFKGSLRENASLKQTVDFTGVAIDSGDTLDLGAYFKGNHSATKAKLILTVTYAGNATPATVIRTIKRNASYNQIKLPQVTLTGTVKKITVTIKNKSTGGALWIDDVSLIHTPAVSRRSEVLPAPAAPDAFRGSN